MRRLALPVLAVLASCGPEAPEAERTGFASSTTGSIAKAEAPSGKPRLAPFRAMTSDAEVLQGDPDVPGQPFVIRIRELPGTIVPPHSHPVDEHVTIVSGTWHFGFGDAFDPARLTALPTGSYAFAPKGSTMFAYAPEGAVVQVHGIGPFHIEWKHGAATLDEKPGLFRFRRGDRVTGPRGEGAIRQGYASGPLVQYEIEGPAGLFMAAESDLSRVAAARGD
ncbi:MAG TPA: cupin domain-containing protein [Allosphingosinicella sp.]|jgi:quercetin dioxygenase-like cupin family protein